MKKTLFLAFVVASVGLMIPCTPLLAAPSDTTKTSVAAKTKQGLREIYITSLKAEGYSPEKQKENEIIFKKDGRTFCIVVDNEFPYFVMIYVAFGFEVDKETDLIKAYQKMSVIMDKTKAAKVYLANDNKMIVFSAEFFYEESR